MSYHEGNGTGTSRRTGPRGNPVKVYDYRSDNGVLVVNKKRFLNKTFEFCRQKDGEWYPSADGVEIPLYHADELAAADAARQLWIAEGEKDCDRLREDELRLLATSPPYGALCDGKKWRPGYSRLVRRFDHVVILEDNDRCGREHAEECARSLRDIGIKDVRVVTFRDMPEKSDVSDWLDAGHTVAELIDLAEAAPQWEPAAWPEIVIPVAEGHGPDFPAEHLSPWLRDFVEGTAVEMQAPLAIPAMVALAVVSTAVAGKIAVHVRGNWTVNVNIYTVIVAGSSEMKTPVYQPALAPLEQWEDDQRTATKAKFVEIKNKKANLEARLAEARKGVTKPKGADATGAEAETERLARELADLPEARVPQLIANDVTEEALGVLLAENGSRMAVLADEGGPFRNMAGRYQKNGASSFEIYKHAHNGGTVRVNRIGRGPINSPNACLTLGVMMQPSALLGLGSVPEFRGEGLLARILYAVPVTFVGERDMRSKPLSVEAAARYRDHVRALLEIETNLDPKGRPCAHVLDLEADAREAHTCFMEEIEPRLGEHGDLYDISDWAGKLRGQVIKIAGLLYMAERAGRTWGEPIPLETMLKAITITKDFFIPNAQVAFERIGGGVAASLAQRIMKMIKRGGRPEYTKRELHRLVKSAVKKVGDLDEPLRLLIEWGVLRDQGRRATGGAPGGPFYEVNPALFAEGGLS